MLFCFLGSTPRVILGSRTPHTPSSTSGPGIIWWSIQFDRVVRLIQVFFFFSFSIGPNFTPTFYHVQLVFFFLHNMPRRPLFRNYAYILLFFVYVLKCFFPTDQ